MSTLKGRTPQLDQAKMFIKEITPYDFTEFMGQYALEIKYTNGDTQMLTTPMPSHMGNDPGDFDSYEDLTTFYNNLKKDL